MVLSVGITVHMYFVLCIIVLFVLLVNVYYLSVFVSSVRDIRASVAVSVLVSVSLCLLSQVHCEGPVESYLLHGGRGQGGACGCGPGGHPLHENGGAYERDQKQGSRSRRVYLQPSRGHS